MGGMGTKPQRRPGAESLVRGAMPPWRWKLWNICITPKEGPKGTIRRLPLNFPVFGIPPGGGKCPPLSMPMGAHNDIRSNSWKLFWDIVKVLQWHFTKCWTLSSSVWLLTRPFWDIVKVLQWHFTKCWTLSSSVWLLTRPWRHVKFNGWQKYIVFCNSIARVT